MSECPVELSREASWSRTFHIRRFLTADSLRSCQKVAETSRFSVSRLQ